MCTLPIKTGLTRLEDGRTYCARDAAESVLDDAEARRVCQAAYDELNRLLIRHLELPWTNVDFAIVGWSEMRQMLQTPGLDRICPMTLGYTRSLQTRNGGWRHTVRVLGGRRPAELQAVLTHELAHAWLHENLPPHRVLERHTVEGFCELLAHQFMQHLGAERELKYIEKNVYSRGQAGLFIATEREYGLHTVLQWMRHGMDPALTGEDLDRIRRIREPLPHPSTNLFLPPVSLAPPAVPDELTLTGVSGTGKRRLALINDRTFGAGETARVRVGTTNITVTCIEIGETSVRIRVEGEAGDRALHLKSSAPTPLHGSTSTRSTAEPVVSAD